MTNIFAHRGANTLATENTMEAFALALEVGADGIELDIHYSKDGQLVVYHDFTLERLTEANGLISHYSADELRAIPFKSGKASDYIPTLSEVFKLVSAYPKTMINIELKAGNRIYPNIEQTVLDQVKREFSLDRVIFSSFDHFALATLKAIHPKALTGVLTASAMVEPWEYIQKLKADFYHPNIMTLDQDVLVSFDNYHLKANPYTVNDTDEARLLIQSGIYGIITDHPNVLISLRDSLVNEDH